MNLCRCGCGINVLRIYKQGHNNKRKNPGYAINSKTGCWNWNGHITIWGYPGPVVLGEIREKRAHRAYYRKLKSEIPCGMYLDHLCRNKKCVNPEHLEAVTPAENTRRGNWIKLSMDKARCIRSLYSKGKKTMELASIYGVGYKTIKHVVKNETWRENC